MNPFEFLDETYHAKTKGMGLLYGENRLILTSTIFDWSTRVTDRQTDVQTDRGTDGIAIAYARLAYAVARRVLAKTAKIQLLLTNQSCRESINHFTHSVNLLAKLINLPNN